MTNMWILSYNIHKMYTIERQSIGHNERIYVLVDPIFLLRLESSSALSWVWVGAGILRDKTMNDLLIYSDTPIMIN